MAEVSIWSRLGLHFRRTTEGGVDLVSTPSVVPDLLLSLREYTLDQIDEVHIKAVRAYDARAG